MDRRHPAGTGVYGFSVIAGELLRYCRQDAGGP